jgi:hypothetical protein
VTEPGGTVLLDVGKDVSFTLRLDPAELDAWRAAADAAGMSLSQWIRVRCNKPGAATLNAPAPSSTKRRARSKR